MLFKCLIVLPAAIVLGWQDNFAQASATLTNPVFSQCRQRECIDLKGKTGSTSNSGYLMTNVLIETSRKKLNFLNKAEAAKIVVQFNKNRINLYEVRIEGKRFDVSLQLDTLELIHIVRF